MRTQGVFGTATGLLLVYALRGTLVKKYTTEQQCKNPQPWIRSLADHWLLLFPYIRVHARTVSYACTGVFNFFITLCAARANALHCTHTLIFLRAAPLGAHIKTHTIITMTIYHRRHVLCRAKAIGIFYASWLVSLFFLAPSVRAYCTRTHCAFFDPLCYSSLKAILFVACGERTTGRETILFPNSDFSACFFFSTSDCPKYPEKPEIHPIFPHHAFRSHFLFNFLNKVFFRESFFLTYLVYLANFQKSLIFWKS